MKLARSVNQGKLKAAATVAVLAVTASLTIAEDESSFDGHTLAAQGKATVSVPAETIRIYVNVKSRKDSVQEAIQDNAERMRAVLDGFLAEGITEEQWETQGFRLEPLHSEEPYPIPPDWEPKLLGYQVENSLLITSEAIDSAATYIELAAENGADSVWISFDVKDREKHREEAIAKAATKARHDAEVLARATGVRLLRAQSIDLDNASDRSGGVRARASFSTTTSYSLFGDPGEGDVPSTLIKAGNVDLWATVTIIYEVEELP